MLASMKLATLAVVAVLMAAPAAAQVVPSPEKRDNQAVQHGAQPNPSEVRPGSRDGDAPSAATGELLQKPGRRLFGLPIATVLGVGGLIVALFVVAGVVIPGVSRRRRAQGGGTYGASKPNPRG